MKRLKNDSHAPAPLKARVLELLAANPGADKRELAKLLGLKGSDRIQLKRVLKELSADGVIKGRKRSGLTRAGELPAVAVIEVTGLDDDGEMLAAPLAWESNEKPPVIYLTPPKSGGAPGPGDVLFTGYLNGRTSIAVSWSSSDTIRVGLWEVGYRGTHSLEVANWIFRGCTAK